MGTNLVGDFGSGGPRGPRGRGVKFRGVIKGHLWQIFKSLDLRQFLSIWAHIRPKNCPPVWIIWIWSKNSGNIPWGSCSPQKVFLLLLNYAPPASHFFPNFWTFFNNLEHRENFETLSSGLTTLVLEWEQKPTFLTWILDKIANSGKTLHVTGPSGKNICLPHEKAKIFGFSWGKNVILPLGRVTCSVFPEFAFLSKIRVKKVGFCSHSKTRRLSTLDSVSKFSLCPKLLKNVQNFGKIRGAAGA